MRLTFPRDITRAGRVRLAGRVAAVLPDGLVVADAFARIVVRLGDAVDAAPGDLVVVEGEARLSDGGPARIEAARVDARYPGKARRGEAMRFEAGVGPALAARRVAYEAIRAFFAERGFVEVETPALVPSPGLDLHLDAFNVGQVGGDARYLITSPEYQMKRLVAGGVFRCFQFARCFRKGEVGDSHNPEFTMLEWYRGFADVAEIVDETEALVRAVAARMGTRVVRRGGVEVDLDAAFERVSVGEAFARHAGVSSDEAIALASTDEDRFFRLLVERVEPALARADHGVFLTDYPAPFASLARLSPADSRVAERFELYVAGVELSNGFGELVDPVEQRARLVHDRDLRARRGLPVYPIDERFLDALDEGLPPTAGNALGVDRLIALCLGKGSIGDALAFPEGWL